MAEQRKNRNIRFTDQEWADFKRVMGDEKLRSLVRGKVKAEQRKKAADAIQGEMER
jgi:hypothetical protein